MQAVNLDQENALGAPDVGAGDELSESVFKRKDGIAKSNKAISIAVIVVGGLIVSAMIYKMISPFISKRGGEEMLPPIVQQEVGARGQQSIPALPQFDDPAADAALSPVTVSAIEVADSELDTAAKSTENAIPASAAATTVNKAELAADIEDTLRKAIAAELGEIKSRVGSIEKALAQLERKVNEEKPTQPAKQASNTAQRSATRSTVSAKSKTDESKKAPVRKIAAGAKDQTAVPARGKLQLKALLDDRAWLQTAAGTTITVAPGEVLEGYGTVKYIDVERGHIVFDDGTVLR